MNVTNINYCLSMFVSFSESAHANYMNKNARIWRLNSNLKYKSTPRDVP